MVTTAAILSETFFVRWLEKSLYECLEVLHGSFTDYGQLSLRFRNAGIKDGCRDDRLGLGQFGLSVVGDEWDTYVDSGRRLFLVSLTNWSERKFEDLHEMSWEAWNM